MCAVLNRPGWFRSILGERGRTWPRCFFELDVVAAGLTFAAVIIETDIAKSPSCESKKAAGCNMQASRPTYRNPTALSYCPMYYGSVTHALPSHDQTDLWILSLHIHVVKLLQ